MRVFKSFPAFFAAAFAVVAISPCFAADKDKDKDKDKNNKAAAHYDPYLRGGADENGIIREVRHNLLMLPYYGVFDDLGFNVNGSTVTLTGQVNDPTLKDDAGNAVKKIKDVTNVVNNIEVLPLSPNDNTIRLAVYRAIYGDASLSARYAYRAAPSIHIIVKNGNVRLEGVVANAMDKQIAGMRAKGVPGIFDVDNELQVENNGK